MSGISKFHGNNSEGNLERERETWKRETRRSSSSWSSSTVGSAVAEVKGLGSEKEVEKLRREATKILGASNRGLLFEKLIFLFSLEEEEEAMEVDNGRGWLPSKENSILCC